MRMQPQPWRPKELGLYALIAISGIVLLLSLRSGLLLLFPNLLQEPSFLPFLLLLEYIILLGPLGIILTSEEHRFARPVKLPLSWPGFRRAILEPAVAWILFIVLLGWIVHLAGGHIPGVTGESVSLSQLPQSWLATALLLITAGIVAPLAEEVLFRGVLLPASLQWLRPSGAIILSGLLFALLHNQQGVLITLFLLGALAGYLAWRNNSIWPAVTLHFLNNMVALTADYTGMGL